MAYKAMKNIIPLVDGARKFTLEDTPTLIEEVRNSVQRLENQVIQLTLNFTPKEPEELMTREEVKNFFKCDLSTIYNWTKKGKLKAYLIGNRVYYKRSEVLIAITIDKN
jgi:hypothetical protein